MDTDDEFKISMRDGNEESMWWNQGEVDRYSRPGKGFLPHILAGLIHKSDYQRYSLQLDFKHAQSESVLPIIQSINLDPESEMIRGLPYEGAYYCPEENGWRILLCTTSPIEPYLAQSFKEKRRHHQVPEMSRRAEPLCVGVSASFSTRRSNKTHHFHKYENAIDSHKLNPPFSRDCWRSSMNYDTTILDTLNSKEGLLFDLYICCQCPLSFISSGFISGAINPSSFNEIIQAENKEHPADWNATDASKIALVMQGVVIAVAICLNTRGRWNFPKVKCQHVKRILEELGFETTSSSTHDYRMKAPTTDVALPGGRETRNKFIRIWWELNAWIAHLCLIHPELNDLKNLVPFVRLKDVRQVHQKAMGISHDHGQKQAENIAYSVVPGVATQTLSTAWEGLGIDPMSTSAAGLLVFAYLAQCRCDPINTVTYFTYLTDIVTYLPKHADFPVLLHKLIDTEKARGRFTLDDVKKAATRLGFGQENTLHLKYDEQIPDEMIIQAWISCLKGSWTDFNSGEELRRKADCSLKQLAEYRRSLGLWKRWQGREQEHINSKPLQGNSVIEEKTLPESKRIKLEPTVKGEEKVKLEFEQSHALQESPEDITEADHETTVEAHPDQKHRSIVYKFNEQRVLAKQRSSYNETISFCRVLFSDIEQTNHIDLYTADPSICQGGETKILEESWGDIAGEIKTITVTACKYRAPQSFNSGENFRRKSSNVVSLRGDQSNKRPRSDLSQ